MQSFSTLPEVYLTDRLCLRAPRMTDADAIYPLADNPKLAAMTANIPSPYPLSAARAWIEHVTRRRQVGEVLAQVICQRDGGALMGVISLNQFRDGSANLAYWLGAPYWGQGFCTEAGRQMLDIAFTQLGLEALTALHLDQNHASGRVLERLGFRFTETSRRDHRGETALFRCYRRSATGDVPSSP